MRLEIESSLREIKKFYFGRKASVSHHKVSAINKEFEEWIKDSFQGNDSIWTLPDLTKSERYENFCRSIRKKIN